jgi:hypothetical protein
MTTRATYIDRKIRLGRSSAFYSSYNEARLTNSTLEKRANQTNQTNQTYLKLICWFRSLQFSLLIA